jgi:hypothetical protein
MHDLSIRAIQDDSWAKGSPDDGVCGVRTPKVARQHEVNI